MAIAGGYALSGRRRSVIERLNSVIVQLACERQAIAAGVTGGSGAMMNLVPPHQLHIAVGVSQLPKLMALGLKG